MDAVHFGFDGAHNRLPSCDAFDLLVDVIGELFDLANPPLEGDDFLFRKGELCPALLELRVLKGLRQPLEEGRVTVARAARTASFPARFMLIAAMNPCPCGFQGDPRRHCRCAPPQVQRDANRISGPLRDWIDLVVEVPLGGG